MGQHELTPIPMSSFSQKDQLMYGGDKVSLAQRYLKDNASPINIQERMTIHLLLMVTGYCVRPGGKKVLNGVISLMGMCIL